MAKDPLPPWTRLRPRIKGGMRMLATLAASDKPRVLLVDDQRFLLRIMLDYLSEYEMQVVGFAFDGTEVLNAIAQATERHGGIDVVIMDEKMPHMNGMEATRALREQFPNLPVILYSASAGILGDAPTKAGVNREVSKADDPKELVRAVKELVGR